MAERWFSEDELREMSRPTMDRAIEAIEAGDLDRARALCEEMKHEWRFLHDMMVDGIAASMTWIKNTTAKRRLASPSVGRWRATGSEACTRSTSVIARRSCTCSQPHLARAFSQRKRTAARRLHDRRGRREGDFSDEPLRLGAAPLANGEVRGR